VYSPVHAAAVLDVLRPVNELFQEVQHDWLALATKARQEEVTIAWGRSFCWSSANHKKAARFSDEKRAAKKILIQTAWPEPFVVLRFKTSSGF
jgi:hypothetical protein